MNLHFFNREKIANPDIEKKTAKAVRDIVINIWKSHKKRKEEWSVQPKEVKDTFFWSKVCTFTILFPIMAVTLVAWKIAVVTSFFISAAGAVFLHKKNFKLSLVPFFCCVMGMIFGFSAKAVLYFSIMKTAGL